MLQFSFQLKFVNNFFVDWSWWTKCQKWKHKCDISDSNWVHTERWFDSFSLLLLCYCQTYQYLERKEKIQRKRIGRQIPTILTTLVKCPGKGNFFYRVTTGSTKDQSLSGTSYSDTIITEDGWPTISFFLLRHYLELSGPTPSPKSGYFIRNYSNIKRWLARLAMSLFL